MMCRRCSSLNDAVVQEFKIVDAVGMQGEVERREFWVDALFPSTPSTLLFAVNLVASKIISTDDVVFPPCVR